MGARRNYPAEYKREAVAMLNEPGDDGEPNRLRSGHRGECPEMVAARVSAGSQAGLCRQRTIP